MIFRLWFKFLLFGQVYLVIASNCPRYENPIKCRLKDLNGYFEEEFGKLKKGMNQLRNEMVAPTDELEGQFNSNQGMRNVDRVIVNAMLDRRNRNFNGVIPFPDTTVNIGGGMKLTYFEAPRFGLYRFTFSASTGLFENGFTKIEVKEGTGVFNSKVLEIRDGNKNYYKNNINYTWMRLLEYGVQVSFNITSNYLRSDLNYPVTFTAELVAN